MSRKLLASLCPFFLLLASLAYGQQAQPRPAPSRDAAGREQTPALQQIVDRMEQAALENRERYRAYVITRSYQLFSGAEEKPSSEVLAQISFVPPVTKEFKIVETRGSSRGETVVRHILEDESKATASGRAPGAVTRDNYDFTYLGEGVLDRRVCFILGMSPKRTEKNLIVGRAWVDKNTYLVRRIQGGMAKMPSWWLKSVDVTLNFGDIGGMWLQTGTTAVAEVRVFGPHTLEARAVKFHAAETVAQKAPRAQASGSSRRPFRRSDTVLGAGIIIQR